MACRGGLQRRDTSRAIHALALGVKLGLGGEGGLVMGHDRLLTYSTYIFSFLYLQHVLQSVEPPMFD